MITNYLALDVGRVRIGLAVANDIARIASPLTTINNDDVVVEALNRIIADQQVSALVVGLPRNLNGQQTEQTKYVLSFVEKIKEAIQLPVHMQDEALTSITAENELASRKQPFEKGDIDALSAVYILEDYLAEGVH